MPHPHLPTPQELRDALTRFSATAKGRAPSIALSPAFGEAGSNGTMQYYLASACDKVRLLPSHMEHVLFIRFPHTDSSIRTSTFSLAMTGWLHPYAFLPLSVTLMGTHYVCHAHQTD